MPFVNEVDRCCLEVSSGRGDAEFFLFKCAAPRAQLVKTIAHYVDAVKLIPEAVSPVDALADYPSQQSQFASFVTNYIYGAGILWYSGLGQDSLCLGARRSMYTRVVKTLKLPRRCYNVVIGVVFCLLQPGSPSLPVARAPSASIGWVPALQTAQRTGCGVSTELSVAWNELAEEPPARPSLLLLCVAGPSETQHQFYWVRRFDCLHGTGLLSGSINP